MKIVVDKYPDYPEDCPFLHEAFGYTCLLARGDCELEMDKYSPEYGKCPYLVKLEGRNHE